jgi:hypothetical protein
MQVIISTNITKRTGFHSNFPFFDKYFGSEKGRSIQRKQNQSEIHVDTVDMLDVFCAIQIAGYLPHSYIVLVLNLFPFS